MEISLKIMTKDLCRKFFEDFVPDPMLFTDPAAYKPYVYSQEDCDAYFARYQALGRVHLAVLLGDRPIGEVILKHIDREDKFCTMGITMQNDAYKNKGYGTRAEQLAIQYAFDTMGMEIVYADSILRNERSQHVLEKVGFVPIRSDSKFRYYKCDKSSWDGFEKRI